MRRLGMLLIVLLTALAAGVATVAPPAAAAPPTTVRISGPPPKELTVKVKDISIKMVLIPSGKFAMGTPDGERMHDKNESPIHEVKITKPFYMAATELTYGQYKAVMEDSTLKFDDPSLPVYLSWNQATEYCAKLSTLQGATFRLPTEAEWEYACRAGSVARWCYPSNDMADLMLFAWFGETSNNKPHPVGRRRPNAWGLYDVHGNLNEWCSDWYAENYKDAKNVDPTGPADGTLKVIRGGCYSDPHVKCRIGWRFGIKPDGTYAQNGMRIVREVAPPTSKPATQEKPK